MYTEDSLREELIAKLEKEQKEYLECEKRWVFRMLIFRRTFSVITHCKGDNTAFPGGNSRNFRIGNNVGRVFMIGLIVDEQTAFMKTGPIFSSSFSLDPNP